MVKQARMTRKRALLMAEKLFAAELQRVAIDANAHDMYGLDTPHAVNMSEYRKKLHAAMNVLFGDQSQLQLFKEEE